MLLKCPTPHSIPHRDVIFHFAEDKKKKNKNPLPKAATGSEHSPSCPGLQWVWGLPRPGSWIPPHFAPGATWPPAFPTLSSRHQTCCVLVLSPGSNKTLHDPMPSLSHRLISDPLQSRAPLCCLCLVTVDPRPTSRRRSPNRGPGPGEPCGPREHSPRRIAPSLVGKPK